MSAIGHGPSRRTFTRLATLALAATRLRAQPPAVAEQTVRPVGFATVGIGAISTIFMQALVTARNARLAAVVTGHPEVKGKHAAALYNLSPDAIYTYDTFARLRDRKDVEAVYIGLPNGMHCDFTIRAAEAGKHVLCEKPMAVSSAECRRMIDACRAANVKLMIAYRVWYDPTFLQALQLVRSGALGQIQSFHGAFPGYQAPGAWRLTKKLGGGGSLFDLGIYPLNAMRFFSGEDPSAYTAVVSTRDKSGRFAEVEQSVDFTLKFPSGIIATGSSSYGTSGENDILISGDKGYLRITNAYSYTGLLLTGAVDGKPINIDSTGKFPFQFTLEADDFADCIRQDKAPKTAGDLGLRDLESIEALYRAAGTPL